MQIATAKLTIFPPSPPPSVDCCVLSQQQVYYHSLPSQSVLVPRLSDTFCDRCCTTEKDDRTEITKRRVRAEDDWKHDIPYGWTNVLAVKNQRRLRYAAGQKTVSGRRLAPHHNDGDAAMVVAKNCRRKGSTSASMAWIWVWDVAKRRCDS